MNILSVSGLHKSFGEHEVLKGISFALEQGETLAVIDRKSTRLNSSHRT